MTQLYTVSFTTQVLVKKYGARGKIVSETRLDRPITLTALPYSTAMSYAHADNFQIIHYVMEDRFKRTSKGPGRDPSVGNGTKKNTIRRGDDAVTSSAPARSKVSEAAATGNMGAALNV
jgi:hypothetical protein